MGAESALRSRFFLVILLVLASVSAASVMVGSAETPAFPSIPVQTDDGFDPVTIIWTGYAPAWWVAANLNGWSDSAYCSSPKAVNGEQYNYTLERPDPGALPCLGPRDHVRVWDMGYSPVYGRWSIGSAHHEHTVCFPCHHVIDSWESAESGVNSTFAHSQVATSIMNLTLGNGGFYQNVYFNGNATMIQLKPPPTKYPVVFDEKGLSNGTSWSVTLNQTTKSSQLPAIIFTEQSGTYPFTIEPLSGYDATPSSGTITVADAGTSESTVFSVPWTTRSATVFPDSGPSFPVSFRGNATVWVPTIRSTGRDNSALSFNVTEVGTRGILNVTIPREAVPHTSSVTVLVDGTRVSGTSMRRDASNYYVSLTVPFGAHSVEFQFVSPQPPYLEYIAIVALFAGIIGLLYLAKDRMKRMLSSQVRLRSNL